ncbi:pseudouridine synthase [Pseudobacter ginsenosidimutans]|uniref:Pseudouridine synthase n=1 Tax=Pseudobacter ginsenosidimutans TaxID=661488 RepID=A0A4Q7MTD4_9BACT|nr:pseudouridine synthase [Pseudobacter ginsenosidimutans]QEC41144.1 pseudouridine synthase [Pseudobacter ginsenosidimutans]RZS72095.1 ribosomal large subunit pseudouridine synthase E [Pseudobacter ginsenosidimutans]
MLQYFIINKPFQVLSQFTSTEDKQSLRDYFKVPSDVYPVGRLDYDSEGLLLLTNDKQVNHLALHPSFAHEREYWVQVEGTITKEAISQLSTGLTISIDGKLHRTKPARAIAFAEPPSVPDRNPPIRFRQNIPTSWISLALTEGKNRQVRRMTAKTGFPTLRLIRFRIGSLTIEGLLPGEMKELDRNTFYKGAGIAR